MSNPTDTLLGAAMPDVSAAAAKTGMETARPAAKGPRGLIRINPVQCVMLRTGVLSFGTLTAVVRAIKAVGCNKPAFVFVAGPRHHRHLFGFSLLWAHPDAVRQVDPTFAGLIGALR